MKYPAQIVSPAAKPRVLWGYISAIMANGRVRNPSVQEKMKKMRRKVGTQLYDVSFNEWTEQAASPIMLANIPTPENMAGGFRPNLSDMNAIRTVVTTRVSPM